MGHDADRGREITIRNIVYTKLSYFELSVMRSIIFSLKTLPKRVMNQAPYIVVPVVFTYLIMDWANQENWKSHRKNPADYANDV